MSTTLLQRFDFPDDAKISMNDRDARQAILRACQGKCFWSGRPLTLEEMHLDHIIPRSLGGPDNIYNLVAADPSLNLYRKDAFDDNAAACALAYVRMRIGRRAHKLWSEAKARKARAQTRKKAEAKAARPTKSDRNALRQQRLEHLEGLRAELLGDIEIARWAELVTFPAMPQSQVAVVEHIRDALARRPDRFLDPERHRRGPMFAAPDARQGAAALTEAAIAPERLAELIDARSQIPLVLADDAHGIALDRAALGLFGVIDPAQGPSHRERDLSDALFTTLRLPVEQGRLVPTRLIGGHSACLRTDGQVGSSATVDVCSRLIRLVSLLDGPTFARLLRTGGTTVIADTQTPVPANRIAGRTLYASAEAKAA